MTLVLGIAWEAGALGVAVVGATGVVAYEEAATPLVRGAIAERVAGALAAAGADAGRVQHAALATTALGEAVRDRSDLDQVAVLRLGAPVSMGAPPFSGWPDDLLARVRGPVAGLPGGALLDGTALADLDPEATARFIAAIPPAVDALAVTGVFSSIAPASEIAVAELAAATAPRLHVSLGHEHGGLDLMRRENATILDCALLGVGRRTLDEVAAGLAAAGVDAPLVVVQGDGLAVVDERARRHPVGAIGGAPAALLAGSAQLAGLATCVVCHADAEAAVVGLVDDGLVADADAADDAALGGLRTALRVPDVRHVRLPPAAARSAARAALVDAVALAAGVATDAPLVIAGPRAEEAAALLGREATVLPGERLRAVALGAARTEVGVTAEYVYPSIVGADARVADATARTRERAVRVGADPARVRVRELDDQALAYVLGVAMRVRVRAVGPVRERPAAAPPA